MGYFTSVYSSELPHRARSVYMYLHDRADKDGKCYPAIDTISRELKLSRSKIKRAITDLKKAAVCVRSSAGEKTMARAVICITSSSRIQVKQLKWPSSPRGSSVFSMSHGRVHDEPSRGTSHSKKYITSEKEQESIDNNYLIIYYIYTSEIYICKIEVWYDCAGYCKQGRK